MSQPSDSRYYRFGICGLTAGGKTCLLAALAMPRVTHPEGLTATLLPVSRNASQHLKDGWDWVDKACQALREGQVPPPNPPGDRCTLRYRFTNGKSREIFIELVDYSGELLDPGLSQSVLAEQLHKYLAEVDGFLFVAEHPKLAENSGELAGYILNLKQALALHRENARERSNNPSPPVALLINKWDRSGSLVSGERSYDEETGRLESFLSTQPPPPHAGLLSELQAASCCCHAFPVSAFGESVREPGETPGTFIEKPAIVTPELPSFGLVEPFMWLVGECDRADTDKLITASRRFNVWWNTHSAIRCYKKARFIAARMSPSSPDALRIRRVRHHAIHCFLAQGGILLLLWLCLELTLDMGGLRKARQGMRNPDDITGWPHAVEWFDDYTKSPPIWHVLCRFLVLNNGGAVAELQAARHYRDEQAWASVQAVKDEGTRATLAESYLKTFPQGAHVNEARRIVTEVATTRTRIRLGAVLQSLSSRLDGLEKEVAQGEKNLNPDFKRVSDKLQVLSIDATNPLDIESADETLGKQWHTIVAGIGTQQARIAAKLAKDETRRKYYAFIKDNEWEEAGKYVAGLSQTEYSDLYDDYRAKAPSQIESKASDIAGNGAAWQKGLDYVSKFQTKQMQDLLGKDTNARLEEIKDKLRAVGDRWLYKQCVENPTDGKFTDYLEKAPLGGMREVAEKWHHFFVLKENKNIYRLGASKIEWGEKAKGSHTLVGKRNNLSLAVGSSKPQEVEFSSDHKALWRADKPADYAIVTDNVIASEPQKIEIHVSDLSALWGFPYMGGVKGCWLLEKLHGSEHDLAGTDLGPNTITLSVEVKDGGEWHEFSKPELPPWSRPQ